MVTACYRREAYFSEERLPSNITISFGGRDSKSSSMGRRRSIETGGERVTCAVKERTTEGRQDLLKSVVGIISLEDMQ